MVVMVSFGRGHLPPTLRLNLVRRTSYKGERGGVREEWHGEPKDEKASDAGSIRSKR